MYELEFRVGSWRGQVGEPKPVGWSWKSGLGVREGKEGGLGQTTAVVGSWFLDQH